MRERKRECSKDLMGGEKRKRGRGGAERILKDLIYEVETLQGQRKHLSQ